MTDTVVLGIVWLQFTTVARRCQLGSYKFPVINVLASSYVSLMQATFILEEGTSVRKFFQDRPVGKEEVYFLNQ